MELNADPENWDDLKKILHTAVEEMVDYLQMVRSRKAWQPIPQEAKEKLTDEFPDTGKDLKELYNVFKEAILPFPSGNIHPRFWGWVNGTGIPADLLPELLIATMNSNVGGREHIANYVERQVLGWFKQIFNFPANSSGLLTTGCSAANLIGLAVARNAKFPDIRKTGISGLRPTYYGSTQIHSSIQKAVEILGVGSEQLRRVRVDENFRIDIEALREQIKQDRAEGNQPTCIIGNAGTVNSGAIDNLEELSKVAEEEGLWFHVDGAFGAIANLSTSRKHLLKGIEKADSLAFDLHKWMYIQYEIGCILVRDEKKQLETFSLRPEYLAPNSRGISAGGRWFTEYGFELSRNFKALKPWFLLQYIGKEKYSKLIDKNIMQAEYVAQKIENSDRLELLTKPQLNVVCFRYRVNGSIEKQNEFNKELLLKLHDEGEVIPSSTVLNGIYALRIAIVNHRSELEDFDYLLEQVVRIGAEMESIQKS